MYMYSMNSVMYNMDKGSQEMCSEVSQASQHAWRHRTFTLTCFKQSTARTQVVEPLEISGKKRALLAPPSLLSSPFLSTYIYTHTAQKTWRRNTRLKC